jgi:hypothetical protein
MQFHKIVQLHYIKVSYMHLYIVELIALYAVIYC